MAWPEDSSGVELGRLLAEHRARCGLSQEELADRSGLSVRAIRDLERGRVRRPRRASLALLAGALDLTEDQRAAVEEAARFDPQASQAVTRPRQLPADIGCFSGRGELLASLTHVLLGAAEGAGPQSVVLAGPGGVGKTALAVRLAHSVAGQFPDGQLWVDLRGMDAPVAPADALRRFLHALGAGPVPADEPGMLAVRYREVLEDRRLLVVLDNAADEAQVRPLLPQAPHCAVVVTARRPLVGVEDACVVALDVLDQRAGLQLLAAFVGRDRVAGQPDAAAAVVAACGGLPLAIRVAAAKLAARPRWTLGDLAHRLTEHQRRLDELRAGDLEVRSSIALSYRSLPTEQRTAFQLLTVVEAEHLTGWLAARLIGAGETEAARILDELAEVQLLESLGFGPGGHERYRLHDLVRLYGYEQLRAGTGRGAVRDAVERAAGGAERLLLAADALHGAENVRPGGPMWTRLAAAGVTSDAVAHPDPVAELRAEYPTMMAVIRHVHDARLDRHTWRLAVALASFQHLNALWQDWEWTHEAAVVAARRSGDRAAEAVVLRSRADLDLDRGRWADAEATYTSAGALARGLGDEAGAASALLGIGLTRCYAGRVAEAREPLDAALAGARACGDLGTASHALRGLGIAARNAGHPEDALARYQECLDTADFGERWRARVLYEVVRAELDVGDLAAAEAHLTQAIDVFERSQELPWQGALLRSLATLQRSHGDDDEAIRSLRRCRAIFRRLGDRRWEGYVLRDLGDIQRERANPRTAARYLAAATDCFEQTGDERGMQQARASLRALADQGLSAAVRGQ